MTNSKSKILLKKMPNNIKEFEVKKRCGDSKTLFKLTGYKPKTTLKEGLEKTLRSFD